MNFDELPQSESYRRIQFDKAEVTERDGARVLTVTGEANCANMEVSLMRLVYVVQPEYAGIEVVGHLPGGICLTAVKSYTVSLPLTGIAGTKGIDVIGADRTERFEL